ncbi:hypothetical protein AGMMS50239_07760 [Bacteroidia bacterium]|nr:hypothetical protein FACS1894207_1530 [Bacteroidia bacterium]GHT59947.1 hypothetical protein AGMMS50239_07760 [Bacteroidia bacterium]
MIERRYLAGIMNLFDIYIPISDNVLIFDNSGGIHKLVSKKRNNEELIILQNDQIVKIKL